MDEMSDRDRIAKLQAELDGTRLVLGEVLRVIVQASTIDSTKLRRGLDDLCDGWGGDDQDAAHEAASIISMELANEILR